MVINLLSDCQNGVRTRISNKRQPFASRITARQSIWHLNQPIHFGRMQSPLSHSKYPNIIPIRYQSSNSTDTVCEMDKINLAINGAAGRMGHRLIDLASQDSELKLVAAIDSPNSSQLGVDSGTAAGIGDNGVPFSDTTDQFLDVVIDFSSPDGAEAILDFCLENKTGLVMATTGMREATLDRLKTASHDIPVVWAPNMSLAVNLTIRLAEIAGKALAHHASGVDVEIIERHHRFKADAPSGTALKFGELIGEAMEIEDAIHGREGHTGTRPAKQIGYHAVRAGDDPGQHTIIFGMLGETIELRVAASNRDCYATGALAAAKFLYGKQPGMYDMFDVLGL